MENQRLRLGLNLNCVLYVLVFVVSLTVFLAGCSAAPKKIKIARESVEEAYGLQRPIVVGTSKKDGRPDWTKRTLYEEGDNVCFSGGFMNGSDYSVSVRCSNAEALKVATQTISQFVRAEFSEYVQGSNSGADGVDRYVEDGIATFVDNLHVQGIRQKEVYYEEVFSVQFMQPTFNIWVQLEMSKADYLKAKTDVLRRMRDKFDRAGQEEAKEKAERLLERLKEEDEAGQGHV